MFFFNRDEMSETGNCYQISLCYIGPWLEMKVHISKNDIFLANRPLNKDHVENKTKLRSFMTKKSDFIISFGSMINREQFYRYTRTSIIFFLYLQKVHVPCTMQ